MSSQHEYSNKQVDSLVAVNIFGATLSLLGSLFIICNYLMFVVLRKNFAFKLIFMIGISDLILSISNLMGAPDHGAQCYIQAILQEIGDISGILWVCAVSWTINKLTILTKLPTKQELKELYKRMHIVIFIITIIFALLPLTTSSYGPSGGWCWISMDNPIDVMWRYLLFYIPLWIAIVYMIVIYCKVYKRLREIPSDNDINSGDSYDEEETQQMTIHNNNNDDTTNIDDDDDEKENGGSSKSVVSIGGNNGGSSSAEVLESRLKRKQNNTLQRMKFYPMILIICYFFASIRRIIDWATEDQTSYILAVLHTFFAAIPGFLNAIVYGFTKDVKERDKEFILEYCNCCDMANYSNPKQKQIQDHESEDDDL